MNSKLVNKTQYLEIGSYQQICWRRQLGEYFCDDLNEMSRNEKQIHCKPRMVSSSHRFKFFFKDKLMLFANKIRNRM